MVEENDRAAVSVGEIDLDPAQTNEHCGQPSAQKPFPTVDILHPHRPHRLDPCSQGCGGNDTSPLTAEENAKIMQIRNTLGTQFCRRCNYCAPCSVGIQIPALFILEGYYSRYDLQDWAVTRYKGTAVKASACIGCGACEDRCPYNLPIRQMLKNVADKFGE